MGTVPTPGTQVSGAEVASSLLNGFRDAMNFMLAPPQCNAYHSTLSSIPNNAYTVIPLQSELFDVVQSGDSPSHDNVTNNSRIVARTAGKYEVSGYVSFASNATGRRAGQVRVNAAGAVGSGTGIIFVAVAAVTGTVTTVAMPPTVVTLAVGDYIEMFGFQDSGGALNTDASASTTFLRMRWVGV